MAVNNNYISINGKKIPLTNEQVEQIKNAGIIKDNPFDRVERENIYFFISNCGKICKINEVESSFDDDTYSIANYCTDKKLMAQRALHETLNRLLWRFSMTHGGDEIDWNRDDLKFYIFYNHMNKSFGVDARHNWRDASECYFLDRQTAEQAIKEIIMPFMEQHPEFVW